MFWMWNGVYYYCKIPSQNYFNEIKTRMELYTSSNANTWFGEISLITQEPIIGEYLPRRKLEFFLENMENIRKYEEEKISTISIQDSINEYNLNNYE